MPKIHILGGPGSGKTTLARLLVARFHIPHYDLDKLGWKNGLRQTAYIEDALVIAEQPGWVTEGIYLLWTDPLLYKADYIVLLEVSWPVAAWRIIRRHVAKSLRGINPYPTKLLLPSLKDTRDYYLNRTRSETYDERHIGIRQDSGITHGGQVRVASGLAHAQPMLVPPV